MQQGGSSYGVTPEVSTQYVGGAAAGGRRGHMMGVSGGGHDMPLAGSHHPHSEQKSGDALAEAASPISSRPPARSTNFDELVTGDGSGLPDDDALAGEETERGTSGNRWPRQETLALLKIRSDMDAAFRDATLKGPLWEEVSRKLAELGYNRSAKKCKEKFENVHKYYKRTKEGRAGRQDGKSYRFFTQLEALQGNPSGVSFTSATNTAAPPSVTAPAQAANTIHNTQIVDSTTGAIVTTTRMPHTQPSSTTLIPSIPSTQPSHSGVPRPQTLPRIPPPDVSGAISLSSGGSSTSGDSSDGIQEQAYRKRKRSSSDSSTRKMMNFFEELMKQVVEKQVALQQRFLETIEKREEDRMIREEAWKRQEMVRLSRELDILSQERAMSASRDAAVIAFLQKITGQTIHIPRPPPPPQQPPLAKQPIPATPQSATTPIQPQPQQQLQHHHHHQQHSSLETRPFPTPPTDIVAQDQEPASMIDPASSRWPKPEVLSLIKLRNGFQSRYEEAGPKGPLWEEISAEMAKMGYKRSAKRCKEKWENINKYYKKVKESNKKRPEDSKTCPYFQELDALYRKKGHGSKPDLEAPHEAGAGGDMVAIMPTPISAAPPETARPDREGGDGENGRGGNGGSGTQVQKGNGAGFYTSVVDEGNGVGSKKPEDFVKELMEQRQRHQVVMDEYTKINGADSENGEPEDDDDEDHEEDEDEEVDDDGETRRAMTGSYQTQYSRQTAPTSAGSTAGSFITLVQ